MSQKETTLERAMELPIGYRVLLFKPKSRTDLFSYSLLRTLKPKNLSERRSGNFLWPVSQVVLALEGRHSED
jgi:hypothetical protein